MLTARVRSPRHEGGRPPPRASTKKPRPVGPQTTIIASYYRRFRDTSNVQGRRFYGPRLKNAHRQTQQRGPLIILPIMVRSIGRLADLFYRKWLPTGNANHLNSEAVNGERMCKPECVETLDILAHLPKCGQRFSDAQPVRGPIWGVERPRPHLNRVVSSITLNLEPL